MATINANLKRSFLDTCMDNNLARIIDRETESANPTTYREEASTMGILDKHFNNLYPIHVRLNKMVSLICVDEPDPGRLLREIHQDSK